MDPVFRSKVDVWLAALVAALPVLLLEFVFEDTGLNGGLVDALAIAIVVVVLVLVAWLHSTTSYTITAEALLVRSGPFSWMVPLREIYSIEPTRRATASPALSLDRLLIRYGGDSELIVSPADKAGFMAAIKHRLNAARGES